MSDSPKDAPVKREHRIAAIRFHWSREEDVPRYAQQWRDGQQVVAADGSLVWRMVSELGRSAQLVANTERDVRASIIERLEVLPAHEVSGVLLIDASDVDAVIADLEAANRG